MKLVQNMLQKNVNTLRKGHIKLTNSEAENILCSFKQPTYCACKFIKKKKGYIT